jgi:hypothetical protein
MLSISHAATGAVIASRVSNPFLSIPLILASHYLEDMIAHWDAGTGLGKGLKTRQAALRDGLIDLVLAGLIVLAFYPSAFPVIRNSSFVIRDYTPIWGAFVGLVPDFLEAPRNFLKYEPWFLRAVNRFHGLFHHSIPRVLDGLAPQLLLLIILWLLR